MKEKERSSSQHGVHYHRNLRPQAGAQARRLHGGALHQGSGLEQRGLRPCLQKLRRSGLRADCSAHRGHPAAKRALVPLRRPLYSLGRCTPAEVDKLPVDVGHLVAYRHRHERTAKPHVRHTSRLFVCWPSGTAAPHDVSSMESIRLLFAPCAADEAWKGSAPVDFVPSFCLRSVDLERL